MPDGRLRRAADTLSEQPGSVVRRNWCSGQRTQKGGALYPDEGSAYMSWQENVLERLGGSRWCHIWNSNASSPIEHPIRGRMCQD